MPWVELDFTWSATWPNLKDLESGVATLHEKFGWVGPKELQDLWHGWKGKMEEHFREDGR